MYEFTILHEYKLVMLIVHEGEKNTIYNAITGYPLSQDKFPFLIARIRCHRHETKYSIYLFSHVTLNIFCMS